MPSEPHFQTAFTIKISYQTLTNAIIPSNEYKADFLPDASSFTLNIPFPANDFVNRLAVAGGMPVSSARRLLRETGWVNTKSSTVNECLEDSVSVNTVFIPSYSAWIFWTMVRLCTACHCTACKKKAYQLFQFYQSKIHKND